MSNIRQIGYLVSAAIHSAPEKEQELCAALQISVTDLQRLYAGRLFLSPSDLEKLADWLCVPIGRLLDGDTGCDYQSVVHCMSPFTDAVNRDLILDLIDAYIDAKEVLCTQM